MVEVHYCIVDLISFDGSNELGDLRFVNDLFDVNPPVLLSYRFEDAAPKLRMQLRCLVYRRFHFIL